MAFDGYGYQNPYYPAPMPDNLTQFRQNITQNPMQGRMVQPQMMPQQGANPVAQGGVQWVSGEAEARGWMIAPNSAVALWDSTAPTVYLKQTDSSGKPELKIYDLVERSVSPPAAPQMQAGDYVTRKEFDALAAAVGKLQGNSEGKETDNG